MPHTSLIHEDLFFFSATVHGMKNAFLDPSLQGIALSMLDQCHQEAHIYLHAYVIMPSNIYAIIRPRFRLISDFLCDFERQSSNCILSQLSMEDRGHLRAFLTGHTNQRNEPSIWHGIHIIKIKTEESLHQKLEFIHNAPLTKPWHFVNNRADYRYSTACLYDRNEQPLITVDRLDT